MCRLAIGSGGVGVYFSRTMNHVFKRACRTGPPGLHLEARNEAPKRRNRPPFRVMKTRYPPLDAMVWITFSTCVYMCARYSRTRWQTTECDGAMRSSRIMLCDNAGCPERI